MAHWTAEKTQEWVMGILFQKYVEDEHASVSWSELLETSPAHPSGEDIVRECHQLATFGVLEILTRAYNNIFVQMTPAGCETWKAFIEERKKNPAAALSFR